MLSYYTWPLGDTALGASGESLEMEGLTALFSGADAVFLVPPIRDRVAIGTKYARAVAMGGVRYAAIIGVQWKVEDFPSAADAPKIARDADEFYAAVDGIVRAMPPEQRFDYVVLHMPMFLENILYQIPRVKGTRGPRDPHQPPRMANSAESSQHAARTMPSTRARARAAGAKGPRAAYATVATVSLRPVRHSHGARPLADGPPCTARLHRVQGRRAALIAAALLLRRDQAEPPRGHDCYMTVT